MIPFDYLLGHFNDTRKFAIRKRMHEPWYLVEVKHELIASPVVWAPRLALARIFPSEEEVETFKYNHLQGRPCEIIELKN
jgi:hypothetical protein